jgi:histone-binding protein RBBP4
MPFSPWELACAREDANCAIYDTRQAPEQTFLHASQSAFTRSKPAVQLFSTSRCGINAVAINPHAGHSHFLLTGDIEGTILLWDVRKPDKSLHTFLCHTGAINNLAWAPPSVARGEHGVPIFASCSQDTRVILWDLRMIGEEIVPSEDQNDAPPETFFVHCGHTEPVSDIAWCVDGGSASPPAAASSSSSSSSTSDATYPWLLASVDESNTLQVWQFAKGTHILLDDDHEPEFDSDV